ncbi:MAG: sugar phosphate nucleotidyltransferase [Microthrixaceae bacterium]
MQMVILSGGLGTRLGELGRGRPKHLVDVLGTPFAHRQLRWLAESGVTDVVECIGHLGDEIVASVGDGSAFGLSVTYSHDGTRPDGQPARPGTGGALALARHRGLLNPRFMVIYGDSWLRMDLRAMWRQSAESPLPATMAVLRNDGGREPSNVALDGELVRYRKGGDGDGLTHIDYGVSTLSSRLLDGLDPGSDPNGSDLADLMAQWSRDGRVAAYEVSEPYDEVGTPAGVARLEAALLATEQSG